MAFVIEALFLAYVEVLFENIVSDTCCESRVKNSSFNFILPHAHSLNFKMEENIVHSYSEIDLLLQYHLYLN